MKVDVPTVIAALEAAMEDQRSNLGGDEPAYEEGYLDGLKRAEDIVVIKAYGRKTALD